MKFGRKYYLDKLILKKHNGLIKVITGIRRCGKSYLLFTLFKEHLIECGVTDDHIIEVAFDSFESRKLRDPDILYPYIKEQIRDNEKYYILLDEVQLLGSFEEVLNGLIRISNADVYVTGSNAKFLSKDIITEFRGRGDELHINPLTFSEFMAEYDGDKYDGWNEYILYGGLPPVVNLKTPEQKIELLKNLVSEVYINDIIGRNNIKNPHELDELLNILSSSIGSLTNPKKIADTFKSVKNVNISQNTVKNYLEYLCDAFLISSAYRYDIKGRNYIDTPLKYYFTDIGLRNAKINFRQLEETHTMENMIYNELLSRDFNVDVGVVPLNQKNESGKSIKTNLEIDFVCNKASKRYYIQSAFALPDENKLKQEQNSLLRINDGFKKIIIVKNCPAPYYTENGILMLGLFDFLSDPSAIDF